MTKIGITQRVDEAKKYSERGDPLDQMWNQFSQEPGVILIHLPNIKSNTVKMLFENLVIDGITLK